MLSKKKRKEIVEALLNQYFPIPQVPLYHHDPFTLLVAVLLSAQSTDAQVNKITPELFNKAGTPEKMAHLTVDEIQEMIRSIGLAPTKAKAIKALSKILIDKFHSKVPQRRQDLESLPGVGRKTASVVLAQAFGKFAFPVDTHIHRLAKRWGLSEGLNERQTEDDLKRLFPKESWHKVHLQMIYFGRKYCPARGHDVSLCPICHAL